jgi:hypothetical protein
MPDRAPASDPNAAPITSTGPSGFSARNNSPRSSATSASAKGPGGFSDRPAAHIHGDHMAVRRQRRGNRAPTFAAAAQFV